jgi:hypothetical protein
MELLSLLHAAILALRRQACLLRRQTPPRELVLEQPQVRRDLPLQIAFGFTAM